MKSNHFERREVARAFGLALKAMRDKRSVSPDQLASLCDFDRTKHRSSRAQERADVGYLVASS